MAKSVTEDCSDSESSEEQRRKKAYKWYKNNAKPTKNNMCLVVDALGDTGISRQDIDLLPWNPDNTKVNKEEMKALKEKKADKTEGKADKKDKKKEVTLTATPSRPEIKVKKEREEEKKEALPKATPYRSKTEKKRDKEKAAEKEKKEKKDKKKAAEKAAERSSKEEKQREDSLTSLDHSSDAGSDADSYHGGKDFSRHDNEKREYEIGSRVYADQDEQHRTDKVEEEHKRKREKRRREKEESKKRSELAKQKSKAEFDERDKKEKEKKASEFASREPKFFAKRQERDASDDSGVEDFTVECKNVEFAPDLYAEQKRTYSVNEELERKREELARKKDERRRLREEAKEKSMPKPEEVTKAHQDESLELAFKWYTRMAMPSRDEFKRQIEIQRVEISTEDVDLLEWNAAGTRVTNISAMNNVIRARMLKEATTSKAPASQRRRQ
jgi:hypothetical protein